MIMDKLLIKLLDEAIKDNCEVTRQHLLDTLDFFLREYSDLTGEDHNLYLVYHPETNRYSIGDDCA